MSKHITGTAALLLLVMMAGRSWAAGECEVRYLHTADPTRGASATWGTLVADAGRSSQMRQALSVLEVRNTCRQDVQVFFRNQRTPLTLAPGQRRSLGRSSVNLQLQRIQCLPTVAGKRPQPTKPPVTAMTAPRDELAATTSQRPVVVQKTPITGGPKQQPTTDMVLESGGTAVSAAPPQLQGNDPYAQQYGDQFSSPPKLKPRPPGSSGGGSNSGSAPPAGAPAVFDRFACNATAHSNVNAFLLAMMSYEIYPRVVSGPANEDGNFAKFRNRFQAQYEGYGMNAVRVIQNAATGTQAAVMSNDDCIFVVFRGSEAPDGQIDGSLSDGLRDWLADFNVVPFPPFVAVSSGGLAPPWWTPGVVVSNGNYLALQSVYNQVLSGIQDQQNASNSKRIFVTGHSLGGALAILTAYQLRKAKGITVRGVYTYGNPKVGGIGFRNNYLSLGILTYRWSFTHDPIPRLPPNRSDRTEMHAISNHLGLPGFTALLPPPPPTTFQHVGNRMEPTGSFETDCNHSMKFYGEGVYMRLNASQRSGLPTAWWTNNRGDPIGACYL